MVVSHGLLVVLFESESVGVAKVAQNLPRRLVTATLDEELIQEEEACSAEEQRRGERGERGERGGGSGRETEVRWRQREVGGVEMR